MTKYINADSLKIQIACVYGSNPKYLRWLNNAPTADVEPVRHGKWIDETFEPWGLVHHPFKCNLCGEHAEFPSPYCPNCGARMDEVDG